MSTWRFKLKNNTLIFLIISLISTASSALTLKGAIEQTLQSNPDQRLLEMTRHATDDRLSQSFAGYFPTLDISAGLSRDRNSNATTRAATGGSKTLTKRESSFTLNQMLFDGFAVKNDVEANAARVKGAAYNVDSSMQDVALRVVETYLEVLRRQTIVRLAKNNLTSHQQIYQQIQARTESGIGRKADLDQATGRLALARTNLMTEQANLRDAEANYIRVVGKEPDGLVHPDNPRTMIPESEDAALALALENHPTLQAADAEIETARAEKRGARSSYYPSLDLNLNGTNNQNASGSETNTNSLTVGLKLSYNLFRGGADRARERETAWTLEQKKEERNKVKRQIAQSLRLSWNAFTSSRAKLKYHKQHADATQRTRDAYQKQFRIGQRTLLDLLDSENELFNAKSTYISAQTTEMLGRFRILNNMGILSEYFNIPLPKTAKYTPRSWLRGW